jgi:hypothetical protein
MMTVRAGWKIAIGVAALVTTCLWAQAPRANYRQLYDTWRQTEPTLEHDAGNGGASLAARAETAANAAKAFAAARHEVFKQSSDDAARHLTWIEKVQTSENSLGPPSVESQKIVNAASQLAARTADSLASTKDPVIQKLRQALEQERNSLALVTTAMQSRQKAAEATALATASLEDARAAAAQSYRPFAELAAQSMISFDRESEGWSAYYAALINPPAINTSQSPAAPARATTAAIAPSTASRPPTTNSLRPATPASRFVGEWAFPATGLFHGPEPEMVALTIKTDNGRLVGSLKAKFRVAAKGQDPAITLEFGGPVTEARNQTFALQTSEGAAGTIDLIPGRAFNLLEINFQTEPKENKIQTANFVLLKQ